MNAAFGLLLLYVFLLGTLELFRRVRSLLRWLFRRHA